jgi:hypothetical protein
MEEQFFNNTSNLPANAYIAVGGDEPPSMTILNEELIERLNARNYSHLRLDSDFFTGASHSQVPMIGFKNGIQFVLNNKMTKIILIIILFLGIIKHRI